MASLEAHILSFNEQDILPYSLRHYTMIADRVVLHDAFSTDASRDIARHYGAEIRDWHCVGVNDLIAKQTKERAILECKTDWCIVADADEMIFFPFGSFHTLSVYESDGVAIVKPRGFEMLHESFPDTEQQIYDVVKMGAPDHKWCSKPILVAPRRIKSINYGVGCHQVWAKLTDGSQWNDVQASSEPETYLMHFHHLGDVDRITRRYAGQQSRHSKVNIANKWGNFEPPGKHAADKRAFIMANLKRVID